MNLGSLVRTPLRGSSRQRLTVGLCAGVVVLLAFVVSIVSLALAASSFPDVPTSHPYYTAITDLASRGIIGGYGNGNFGPSDTVTRQQFAKMIVGTGGYSVSESDVCYFTDVQKGGPSTLYPDNFVAVCAAKGITTGTTATTFNPTGKITRYQVISMVVRMADDLQPGLLAAPPAGWVATGTWGNNATHGANAARAEYNGLLEGLNLATLTPSGSMNRGEVAQVLHNLLGLLPSGSTTTTSSSTTTTLAGTPGKTRENPIPVGQQAQVGDWRVRVVGSTLDATQTVLAENMFNDEPEAGSQYVIVRFDATYTGQDTSTFWLDVSRTFVGSKGNTFSGASVVVADSVYDVGEAFPGASVSVNLVFEVPSDQVSGGCLMLEDYESDVRMFFAIQ
jgi:hypothetical protein